MQIKTLVCILIVLMVMVVPLAMVEADRADSLVLSYYNDKVFHLLTSTPDGEYQEIYSSKKVNFVNPEWSNDHQRFVYSLVDRSLWLFEIGKGETRELFKLKDDFYYNWSVDGTKIAVMTTGVLKLYDWQTGEWSDWISEPKFSGKPFSLSPDGKRMVLSYYAGVPGLYIYDLESKEVQTLFVEKQGYILHPQWSPDGQRIAYGFDNMSLASPGNEVRIYDLTTAQIEIIVSGLQKKIYDLSWSKQRNELAFVSEFSKDREYNVYLVRPDGTNFRILNNSPGSEAGGVDW